MLDTPERWAHTTYMTNRIRTKADVEFHDGYPALNIKWHAYWPDMVAAFRNAHEFSDDADFWKWADEMWENDDETAFMTADTLARETCMETFVEDVAEIMDVRTDDIWQAGRCGGWLVVEDRSVRYFRSDYGYYKSIDLLSGWDAIRLAKWRKCAKVADSYTRRGGECDYQFIWHLYVNVYEARAEAWQAEMTAAANVLVSA